MSRSAAARRSIEPHDLKAAFGRFATGVAFVTAEVDGAPHGLIVSSFAAVSLTPALISFCPARTSLTWRRMRAAGRFAVNVLGAEHAAFAGHAAAPGADRFAQPLEDPIAVLSCELYAEHAAGDHWIVVGQVLDVRLACDADPLVYFRSRFRSLR
jgi:3-hydroxy-9,10-secoandrosta-1,3,5(10)-triene-9,17-dione monooxygenase reductase component